MRPSNMKSAFAFLAVLAGLVYAQSPAARPQFNDFEVATIKPTPRRLDARQIYQNDQRP